MLHQDQALWDKDFPDAVNIWLAVSPATMENGCLVGCPGSHLKGRIEHEPIENHPWHDGIVWQKAGLPEPVPYELNPGEAVMWDRWFAHGSGSNLSANDRWGVVMVFVDRRRAAEMSKDYVNLDPAA